MLSCLLYIPSIPIEFLGYVLNKLNDEMLEVSLIFDNEARDREWKQSRQFFFLNMNIFLFASI